MLRKNIFSKFSFLWITGVLFLASFIGHWTFAWFAYVDEQNTHAQVVELGSFFVEVTRDTLENWQSEFLQLMWQVAALSFLFYVGSPQSKEGDQRKEEKIDHILRAAYGSQADDLLERLEKKYPKK